MIELKCTSSQNWLDAVMADFDRFLCDHASCEKKASSMALTFVSHYPDKPELVRFMLEVAIEELEHFRDVNQLIESRGLKLLADEKDQYVGKLLKLQRKGEAEKYFLDRLLIAGIVEARGQERFRAISKALEAKGQTELYKFYETITKSEARHHVLFLNLAQKYFSEKQINARLPELLVAEAEILNSLEIRPRLH